MIWVNGKVVPDHELKISALDRTFEHGLGLFETLRTFHGQAPLLVRHLDRLCRSADKLGLWQPSIALPSHVAVAQLIEQEGIGPDVMLRIVLTGGVREHGGGTLFMRALPLPPTIRREGAIVELGSCWIDPGDELAQHKSLNYWDRRRAFERAKAMGFDETLVAEGSSRRDDYVRNIWEGSRTNLFLVIDNQLVTPPLSGPIVPGIMRTLVLQRLEELAGLTAQERLVDRRDFGNATEVFLTNSVRGIIPVSRLLFTGTLAVRKWDAPGPWTRRLSLMVSDWLENASATP
jgi:branched-chain amino acid aminotransferase